MIKNYEIAGHISYGTAIAGLGVVHFLFPGFRPVFLPLPSPGEFEPLPVVFGVSLVVAGAGLVWNKERQLIAGLLAAELTVCLLLGHLPNRLRYHPEILGVWTDAIKLMALLGGALIVAQYAPANKRQMVIKVISGIAPTGVYLFALMLILFGLDHFLYTPLVSSLIPAWIPFKICWTYFTGAALLVSGILIALNLWRRRAGLLLALMLVLWLVLLHLPACFSQPNNLAVNMVSSFECLAFGGTAILCSGLQQERTT